MSHIFISYRRNDSANETGRIYDHLEDRFGRGALFRDVDTIASGDSFRERINEAIEQCQVVLVVMGANWLSIKDNNGRRRLDDPNDWVRVEVETSFRKGVHVIPVLLGSVNMPRQRDLPKNMQPLIERNAARVRQDPDFRRDMERVFQAVERHFSVDDLTSQKNIDYRKLQSLLRERNWRDADRETLYAMSEASGGNAPNWLGHDEIKNIPCSDLRTINRLWMKYSRNKFGFSVQLKKWKECGSPVYADWSGEKGFNFCQSVGWIDFKRNYSKRNYSNGWERDLKEIYEFKQDLQLSPSGEFPYLPMQNVWGGMRSFGWHVLSHINSCGWSLED